MAQSKRLVSPIAMLLGIVLAWVLFGAKIKNGLYAAGLIPRATLEDVLAELRRGDPRDAWTCQPGTDGWEFICEQEHHGPHGYQFRQTYGILSSWITPVQWRVQFDEGKPRPSVEEYFKNHRRPY